MMILKQIILLLVIVFIAGCASQIGPSGGEVDKVPPEIINTYPADRTINFSDNYLAVEFSEYVDKRSVQEAIFISPSIDGKIEYDWSGTELEIEFEDSLRKNITYSITIGTDVIDLNNRNNMASSFSFTFATGPEIDNGQVQGKVYDKAALGTLIFAYVISDTIPNPSTQKPDYLSQVGTMGDYWLQGMANGLYRIFAINDNFRDFLYNPTDDMYGTAFKDVQLSDEDSLITGIDFLLSIEDTTAPAISEVTNTDRSHILVEFTEAIDSARLSADNFYIYDSTSQKRTTISMVYKDGQKSTNYFICFDDSLNEENENYLSVENIFDKVGNKLLNESVPFAVSDKVDTLAPSVKSITTEYPQSIIDFEDPYLEIHFNDGVKVLEESSAFIVLDEDSIKQNIVVETIDNARKRLSLKDSPKPNQEYQLIVDYKNIFDAVGNSQDTTYVNRFKTISELEFSAASGIVGIDSSNNIVLELTDLAKPLSKYTTTAQSDNTFKFSRVKPGLYILRAFVDSNNDNQLTTGNIDPFKFSEQFKYYPDTLKLNARWPVGDVQLNFNSSN
jgi:hypothetical protein